MQNILEKAWAWILTSSANPQATSLSVKGFLTGAATLFTVGIGLAHVTVPGLPDQLNGIIDGVVAAIQAVIGTLAAVSFAWGAVRKLWLTVVGKNQAVTPQ